MSDDSSLVSVLRANGYRVTPQRRLVWEVLHETAGHLTAEQIAARVQQHREEVNLASVYRALSVLAELDLVRESRLGDSDASTWELAHPDEHFHLVCERCGSVTHHVGSLVEEIAAHLREGHDFEPSGVELVVTGVCARCRRS